MTRRRKAIAAALLMLLVLGSFAAHLWPVTGAASIDAVLNTIRRLGAPAWLGLILVQMLVASSGILPASLTGVAAGALYGIWLGFGLAAVGTLLGAALAFWLSRSLFRPLAQRFLRRRPQMENLDAALGRDGWKLVCILRMSPIMPFVATSYALGLSSVSARHYGLGTLAALPALLGYVVLGSLVKSGLLSLSRGAAPLHWVLLSAGVMATVVLIAYIGRVAAGAGLLTAAAQPRIEADTPG
jgi:uncharacterized membrane protein YdjX (TVP38/TMEM64 family)